MKTFVYKGFDTAGKPSRGLIEALDLKNARERLAARGVLAEQVAPAGAGAGAARTGRRKSFTTGIRSMFYRETAAMLAAGLPIARALEILINAPESEMDVSRLAGVRDRIREGASLGRALNESGMVMEEFERAAIQVGEHSGALPGVLDRLADFLEERRRLHDRIQTAMIYPSLVLTVALLLAVVMLGVMIPRFARLFADSRIALPWITRWMLQSGQTLMLVLVLLPVLGFGVGLVLRRYAGRDPEWALRLNRILFRLPLVKRGYTALVNLRFTRTLALLLEGGVSLVDAVPMAGRATGSAWVNRLVARQADEVRHGRSLAEAIRGVPPLAGSLPGWIQAGEAGGDLPNMLEQAARRYEREWNRVIERSMELLEPLLIIVIGTLVLLLALSVLLPVLSLNQTLL